MISRPTLGCSHWWEFVYTEYHHYVMITLRHSNGPDCCDFSRRLIFVKEYEKKLYQYQGTSSYRKTTSFHIRQTFILGQFILPHSHSMFVDIFSSFVAIKYLHYIIIHNYKKSKGKKANPPRFAIAVSLFCDRAGEKVMVLLFNTPRGTVIIT